MAKQESHGPHVDAFLADLVAVCRKHAMTLGHEDSHGAFVVYDAPPDEQDAALLLAARYCPMPGVRTQGHTDG